MTCQRFRLCKTVLAKNGTSRSKLGTSRVHRTLTLLQHCTRLTSRARRTRPETGVESRATLLSQRPKSNLSNVKSIQLDLPPKTSAAVGQLLDTTRLEDIMLRANSFFVSKTLMYGCLVGRHRSTKALTRLSREMPTPLCPPNCLTGVFFVQVKMNNSRSGGDASSCLHRLLIAAQVSEQDRGQSFTKVNIFGAPYGTTFERFLQLSKVVVSNVTNYPGLLAPDDRWMVEITLNKVGEQFSSMAICFFRGVWRMHLFHIRNTLSVMCV